MSFHRSAFAPAILLFVAAAPAAAHTGMGGVDSFHDGLLHPIGGLDHVLAMVAVGLWAGSVRGRAIWAWPLAFVSFMSLGGGLGFSHVGLPAVETGIGLSVFVLGAAIAFGLHLPTAFGAALCGVFALFHGHAHGAEMAADAGAIGYGAGFILATGLLHALGIGLAVGLARSTPPVITRLAGAGVALAGVVLLAT